MSCHSSGSLEGGCPSSAEVIEDTENQVSFSLNTKSLFLFLLLLLLLLMLRVTQHGGMGENPLPSDPCTPPPWIPVTPIKTMVPPISEKCWRAWRAFTYLILILFTNNLF